jgi:hypothetical protein
VTGPDLPKKRHGLTGVLRASGVNRFLNTRHIWPVRVVVGAGAAAVTLLATGQGTLAAEMFRRIHHEDHFRKALRRLSFYLRRSWLRINLSRDPMFVFCSDLDLSELRAMRRFLERRRAAHPPGLIDSDLSYVSAMAALVDTRPASLAQFAQDTDRMLAAIRQTPARDPVPAPIAPRFDTDQAAMALADFADCMGRAGVEWFVLSGTLLGIVREGGFLPHDDDIDAGIMAETTDISRMIAALQADPRFHCNDLEHLTSFEADENGHIQKVVRPVFLKAGHRGGVHVDVFIHHREGPVIWHASSLFRWDNAAFDLVRYDLAGTVVLGPGDADRYLTENYGKWRIPVTQFNSAVDTTNQHLVRNPLSVAIFLRRIWLIAAERPAQAKTLLALLRRGGFIRGEGEGERFDGRVFQGDSA